MRKLTQVAGIGIILFFSAPLLGGEPQVSITGKDSYNGFATVAGVVKSASLANTRISVKCGRTTYTTVPDDLGNWALVFRHTSINFYVSAWDVEDGERSNIERQLLSIRN